MSQVAVKFLLESGHYICVPMDEDRAVDTILKWKEKTLPPVLAQPRTPTPAGPLSWAVDTSKVVGIHTFDLASLYPPQMMGPAGGRAPGAPLSGFPLGR